MFIGLPELSAEEITALVNAPKRNKSKPKSFGIAFDSNNNAVIIASPTAAEKGGFIGKTGSSRRSRKGRVYKAANGWSLYDGLSQLPAYKV